MKKQRVITLLSAVLLMLFGISDTASAMHIMEGYLQPKYCIAWGIICLPFLYLGFRSIQKTLEEDRKSIVILAIAGAFIFVLSSLKIPSVTGSCSHMTGTGLAAILFGPYAVSILGLIVLVFQAILLAHGGITTLGANTFSMAIAGPIVAYLVYKLLNKAKVSKRVSVFFAAVLGDLFTYCVTSIQLAIAYPSPKGGVFASMAKFLGIFATTQIPLAIIEGILTVIIIIGLEKYANEELTSIGFFKEAK